MENQHLTEKQIEELQQPLDKSKVKSRMQGWGSVDYVEAWQAIDEANKVFNFNWNRETIYCKEVCRYDVMIGKDSPKPGFKVGYEAKVRVEVAGIIKEGTGHGCGAMTDLFDCIESAAKEAESDAMKRALMMFGYRFGLALYDKERQHVEVIKVAPKPDSKLEAASAFVQGLIKVIAGGDGTNITDIERDNSDKLDRIKTGYPALYKEYTNAIDKKVKEALC